MSTLNLGIPPQTETLLEWANILHDEITGDVWYCDTNSGIFTGQIIFTSGENDVYSQFWSFGEKLYFIT